ncbi:MFS transporter [Telmatospirillum sp.]|uniref:MFS transporter n=1 Tax=Telmatospirillum sp. TaxID=2079197 RepID=UPI0028494E93|nr:MFS transporter [Telmatospirillum sp.]MDR3437557.1 MFS transporter [Telmatospirillum sp.]
MNRITKVTRDVAFLPEAGPPPDSQANRSPSATLLASCQTLWPVLHHGEIRWFMASQLLSVSGSWMTRIAVSWLVFRLTDSALWLGIASFAGQIPVILLAPWSGRAADRCDRRRLLCLANGLASGQALSLAGLAFWGELGIENLIGMALLRGCISALELPVRQAFLCQAATNDSRLSAVAVDSVVINLGRLLGPSLAGLVIALGGESSCFLIDGLSYIVPMLVLSLQPSSPVPMDAQPSRRTEPLGQVLRRAELRLPLLHLSLVSLIGLPFTVLLPALVRETFGGGAELLGWLVAMSSLGAILAAGLIGRPAARPFRTRLWPAALASGAFLALLGLSDRIPVSLLAVLGASFCLMWQIVAITTVLQERIQEEVRGRLSACCVIAFWGVAPFGNLLGGVTTRWLPLPGVFCLAGLLCAGLALLPLGAASRLPSTKRRLVR